MQRFILACVLAVLATCGHAADTVIYYGPSGEVIASGKYTRVTISWVNGQAVMTQQVVLDIGGGPIPPPPVDDVAAKVAGLLSSVTADPTKAETSKGLAEAYRQVLATQAVMQGKADILRKVAETLIDAVLSDPKVGKTATWKPFTDGMKTLAAPLDFAGVVNLYSIAQAQLGGGPVPPPIPPPPPVTTAVKAVILRESGNQSQPQAMLFNQIRNDPAWSKLVEILDPNQKTQDKQPDPLAQAAVKHCGSHPLPRLLYLDAAGSFVGECDSLPATFDALKAALTAKGVRP